MELIIFFLFISTIVLIIYLLFSKDKLKKCAWCNSSKLIFTSGNAGQYFWDQSNLKGSRDKRFKNNFKQAEYKSKYKCSKCNAETEFEHYKNIKPSKNIKTYSRKLSLDGIGLRIGSDINNSLILKEKKLPQEIVDNMLRIQKEKDDIKKNEKSKINLPKRLR
jgi:hypothetical protein